MEFEMWIYRGLIVLLGGGLLWFIREFIGEVKSLKKEVRETFKGLNESIARLNLMIASEQSKQDGMTSLVTTHGKEICDLKQVTNKHGEDIAVLKERVK